MRSADRLGLQAALAGLAVTVSGIVLAAVLTGTTPRAKADPWLLDLGARAMAFPGAHLEESRSARLNGVELSFRTQAVEASLRDVLAHFREVCVKGPSSRSPLVETLSALAIRTAIEEDHGYVACLSLDVAGLPSLAARVKRFARTGDLADLGGLRYAYAHRSGSDAATTLLFTVWSDGSLPLGSFMPRAGSDTTGEDLPGVPRPGGSTRLLSFHEHAGPSRIAVYRSPHETPADAAKIYREQLVDDHWIPLRSSPAQPIQLEQTFVVAAERDDAMLTAVAHADGNSGALIALLLSEAP